MKIVEEKIYDIVTDTSEYGRLTIVIDELNQVLKLFDTIRLLTFNDYDDEICQCNKIIVDKEDVRSIKILFEALVANEVEGLD